MGRIGPARSAIPLTGFRTGDPWSPRFAVGAESVCESRRRGVGIIVASRYGKVQTTTIGAIEDDFRFHEHLAPGLKTWSAHGLTSAALRVGSVDYDRSTTVHDVDLEDRFEVDRDDGNAPVKVVVRPRRFTWVSATMAGDARNPASSRHSSIVRFRPRHCHCGLNNFDVAPTRAVEGSRE